MLTPRTLTSISVVDLPRLRTPNQFETKILPKNSLSGLTANCSALFSQSRQKRASGVLEVVLAYLDCKLELNFVPAETRQPASAKATARGPRITVGARIEFFVVWKMRSTRWFFEIYIQGSKNNFLELSLRNTTGR